MRQSSRQRIVHFQYLAQLVAVDLCTMQGLWILGDSLHLKELQARIEPFVRLLCLRYAQQDQTAPQASGRHLAASI